MTEQETKTLITWTEGRFRDFIGTSGGIRVFHVNWNTRIGAPTWKLRADLPGLSHKTWESDDREELYRAAEKELAAWLALVGQTAKETVK